MNKTDLIWFSISLFVGVVTYLTTMDIIISLLIILIYVAYYFLLARRSILKYQNKITKVHCCYHFINSFLVTLSVKESLEEAYQSGIRIDNKELNEISMNTDKMKIFDRIIYLRTFFDLAIYKMFLNVLNLYQDQGGNILTMSDNLLRECTRTEKTLNETVSIGNKHVVEFVLLWIMSFGIVLFMRFGISEFYMMMIAKPLFIFMLFCFYLICLISIHLFIKKYTSLTIKEDTGNE